VPFRVISQKAAVCVVYAGAMFISVMDQTIVNVALAAIGRQFHTPATVVAGTVIAYQVSVALSIPVAAWLGDRIGPRQLLLGSIAIFTVASALCGLAGSLDEMVAFRVLQGIGGGLMTPVGLTMLFRAFPQAERVRASAILVVPTALAPAIGPVIGGLFVTDVTWRWVFYATPEALGVCDRLGCCCLCVLRLSLKVSAVAAGNEGSWLVPAVAPPSQSPFTLGGGTAPRSAERPGRVSPR